ncbi:MAG: DNA topoisomerase I, partial [Firmicutes bacterium]|nr:DNA topoisomerase I [Bacillota bacterium]
MSETKKNLVIVESPSKAKTIEKYLGTKYKVIASKGHVRDLPKSRLGIDVKNGFEPQYINIRGKAADIKMLRDAAKEASKIYLATDPDREGEAISWHLATLLGIDPAKANRVAFNEITKQTVQNALKNPRPIDKNLVDAQQARRVLDRLVGYEISPVLWKKVRRGLSAGRVQSAALKILCERENKINAFVPEEYWTVWSVLEKGRAKFVARLAEKNGRKFAVSNAKTAEAIVEALKEGAYTVRSYEEKERLKKPFPPYNTSSLQQDASI